MKTLSLLSKLGVFVFIVILNTHKLKIKLSILVCILIIQSFQLNAQKTYGRKLLDSLGKIEAPTYQNISNIIEGALPKIINDKDSLVYSECLLTLSVCYYNQNNYSKLDKTITESLNLINSNSSIPIEHKSLTLNNAAVLEKTKGNHIKANNLLLEAIETGKKVNIDAYDISNYYNNISLNYKTLGDFKNALKSAYQLLEYAKIDTSTYYYKPNPSLVNYKIGSAYYEIGSVNSRLENYDLASNNFKLSLDYLLKYESKNLKEKHRKIIEILNQQSKVYLKKEQYGNMLSTINKTKSYQEKTKYREYVTNELLGRYYLDQNKHSKAQYYFETAIDSAKVIYKKNKEFPAIARIYMGLGDLYQNSDKLEALKYYQLAAEYFDNKTTSNLLENPRINNIVAFDQAQEILVKKAQTAFSQYKSSNNIEYLNISSNAYISVIKLLDKMRLNYLSEGSKFYIVEKAQKIYEDAISVLYEVYKKEKKEEQLNQILTVIEKNKSTILFESISQKLSLATSELPKKILDNERDLKSDISFYKKLISQEKSKRDTINLEKIKELESILFERNESYAILDNEIKNNFPKYYLLKTQEQNNLSIQSIQTTLNPDELLIEIFQGSDYIYNLSISKTDVFLEKQSNQELNENITLYLNWINKRPNSKRYSKINMDSISYRIYQQTLKTTLDKHSEYQNLIIVTDGLIGKIPLEPLCIDNQNNTLLIEKHAITYLYSVKQLLTTEKEQKKNNQKILCLAPSFSGEYTELRSCNSKELSQLPFANEELKYLSDNFKGLFLESNKANKSNFLSEISKYPIVHLATHACLNTEYPSLSQIHFSDGHLTNYDIENLSIKPELIVLSACNTGQGNLQKGEGMISLSRGFFEAGVKSLQSSLWSINDQSSFEIVKGMYTHLKNGENKANALRMSKLDYIKKSDKFHKQPFFWAGIIQIGDPSPLFKTNSPINLSLIALLIFIVTLVFILYRIKSKQS